MPTPEETIEAVRRLNQSERGHAAAVQLRKLLCANSYYALGLDDGNWRALETLLAACRMGAAGAIIDMLPRR